MTVGWRDEGVPRLEGVDVLRGVSIVAVVMLHIMIRFSFVGVRLGGDWGRYARHFVFQNGGNGVTVFFAVSGFLITLTSLRRFGTLRGMKPRVFYRIRFARIAPLLVLLLAVLSVLHLLRVDGYVINTKVFTLPRALLSALTFHLNWLETARNAYLPACWTVLWSLSIEEMFYLFFPIACVVLLRWRRAGAGLWIALALALVAMGPFARTVWSKTDLAQENSYLAGMASIALGCVSAWIAGGLRGKNVRQGWMRAMQGVGWVVILVIAVWPRWQWLNLLGKSGLDDTVLALAACLVMVPAAVMGSKGRWWSAPMRWMGRHSYEVYLSHEFVVVAGVAMFARTHRHGSSRPVAAMFVCGMVAATVPLAWVLARWFAEPMNRWLRPARV